MHSISDTIDLIRRTILALSKNKPSICQFEIQGRNSNNFISIHILLPIVMSTKPTRNRFSQRRNAKNNQRPDKRPVKPSSEQVLRKS